MSKVQFNFIRYANCWEDADVLLNGLKPKPGSQILSIASGGDNAFALLTAQPEILLAVDISAPQLYLMELKKVAIRELEYENFLQFIGIDLVDDRIKTYQVLSSSLSSEAKAFWDQRLAEVQLGIIHIGKFERYFQVFRKYLLPFIHSQKTILQLFQEKSPEDQLKFYNNEWNTKRWKLLFRIFFSRFVLGKFGRDPAFLNEVTIPVADFIFKKAAKELSKTACTENYFLRMILIGEFGSQLPYYIRRENYGPIRERLNCLQIEKGLIQECFNHQTFDAFNLSNIFEYMPKGEFHTLSHEIHKAAKPQARVAYWNLMVPRHLSEVSPSLFTPDKELSTTLSHADKGFFYRNFQVDVCQ